MDIIEHNGENYYVLLPVDDDSDELEYVILRETGEGEEKTLVGIDDEKTLDDVFKKYQKHSTDENWFIDSRKVNYSVYLRQF